MALLVSAFRESLGDRPVRLRRYLERVDHNIDVERSHIWVFGRSLHDEGRRTSTNQSQGVAELPEDRPDLELHHSSGPDACRLIPRVYVGHSCPRSFRNSAVSAAAPPRRLRST